ncbi:MAG: 3'-5' exonuclease, partial [Dehalococcoidia bacterium]|nr:3'-5' exonuclease [Dehalococcoidia bacterium]
VAVESVARSLQAKWSALRDRIDAALANLPPDALAEERHSPAFGRVSGHEILWTLALRIAESLGEARLTRALLEERPALVQLDLTLDRPLVALDLQTTGLSVERDRIVAIAALKIFPDGETETRHRLINPGIPIPPEATAVHGLTDAAVADAPTFRRVAKSFAAFLADADLAGYAITRFDLPLLEAEFARAGVPFSREGRVVLDVLTLAQRVEPRSLATVYQSLTGKAPLTGPDANVTMTRDILAALLHRHADLPRDLRSLVGALKPAEWIDSEGKVQWRNGLAVIMFGQRYRGVPLAEVARQDRDYLEWVVYQSALSDEVKQIVRGALVGTPLTHDGSPVDLPF